MFRRPTIFDSSWMFDDTEMELPATPVIGEGGAMPLATSPLPWHSLAP